MTTFLLIRHATTDLVGQAIAGRSPGVHLNAGGRAEAEMLVERLTSARLDAIYASPRERARETAAPVAARHGLEVQIAEGIDEVEFGDWTGHTFRELEADPQWAVWNRRRTEAVIPGGERLADAQRRFVSEMEQLAAVSPGTTIALVSHGEPIKTALAHVLGLSLDHLARFDIAPASVSVVVMNRAWAEVRLINGQGVY